MRRRPPGSTLFPSTTLCRSVDLAKGGTLVVPAGGSFVRTLKTYERPNSGGAAGTSLVSYTARGGETEDRKSTHLNSSHANISDAVFRLKKKKKTPQVETPNN